MLDQIVCAQHGEIPTKGVTNTNKPYLIIRHLVQEHENVPADRCVVCSQKENEPHKHFIRKHPQLLENLISTVNDKFKFY